MANTPFGAEFIQMSEIALRGGRTSSLYTMVSGGVTYIWSADGGWRRQD